MISSRHTVKSFADAPYLFSCRSLYAKQILLRRFFHLTKKQNAKNAQSIPIALPLSRKKSLPDVQELPRATYPMPREEVSALGSARREEVRRQIELNERLKANPLLYLVSPQVKVRFDFGA